MDIWGGSESPPEKKPVMDDTTLRSGSFCGMRRGHSVDISFCHSIANYTDVRIFYSTTSKLCCMLLAFYIYNLYLPTFNTLTRYTILMQVQLTNNLCYLFRKTDLLTAWHSFVRSSITGIHFCCILCFFSVLLIP